MEFVGLLALQETLKRNQPQQTEDEFYQFHADACFPRCRRAWSTLKTRIALLMCAIGSQPKKPRAIKP
jgi:hypothetical protein